MRVSTNQSSGTSRSHTGASSAQTLRKSEVLEDLFNNQSKEDDRDWAVKVRISKTSKALAKDFKERVHEFLNQNKEVAEQLDQIQLPHETEAKPGNKQLYVRKLKSYVQWLAIKEQTKIEASNQASPREIPYLSIHKQGKNDQIRSLHQEHHEVREQVRDHRKKDLPNYYYMIYPETYSFN